MKRLGVVAALVLAALVASLVQLHGQGDTIARQAATNRAQEREISALQSSVDGLLASVSSPTDPLSAYTDICNTQLTNSATGITQTFYYPCTNQAQTIPQPGN
jgi:hypothetical protein